MNAYTTKHFYLYGGSGGQRERFVVKKCKSNTTETENVKSALDVSSISDTCVAHSVIFETITNNSCGDDSVIKHFLVTGIRAMTAEII